MWTEKYENLSPYEKGEFRRLANYLLSHSYIVKNKYDAQKRMSLPNEDFRMMVRILEVFKEYFEVIGWSVTYDENYGYISMLSLYDNNRLRLDRFTTLFLYTLRLIFEEEREKINNIQEIMTDTATVVEKMMSFGLLPKKTTIKDRISAQRTLAHFNIIQKIETIWLEDGNRLIINPSILSMIPGEAINQIKYEIDEMADYAEGNIDEENILEEDDDE